MRISRQPVHSAYGIFTRTICEGIVPAWYDESNFPVIYGTEFEAQCEIANELIQRLQEFLDGEREFADAISTDDFILPVDVWADGSISTEAGEVFGKRS